MDSGVEAISSSQKNTDYQYHVYELLIRDLLHKTGDPWLDKQRDDYMVMLGKKTKDN